MGIDCTTLKVGDWVAYCKYDCRKDGSMLYKVSKVTAKQFVATGNVYDRVSGKKRGGINGYRRPATGAEVKEFLANQQLMADRRSGEESYNAREDVRIVRQLKWAEDTAWLALGIDELKRIAAKLNDLEVR